MHLHCCGWEKALKSGVGASSGVSTDVFIGEPNVSTVFLFYATSRFPLHGLLSTDTDGDASVAGFPAGLT